MLTAFVASCGYVTRYLAILTLESGPVMYYVIEEIKVIAARLLSRRAATAGATIPVPCHPIKSLYLIGIDGCPIFK